MHLDELMLSSDLFDVVNGWSRVTDMFGPSLTASSYLRLLSLSGYLLHGRGAVFLFVASSEPISIYSPATFFEHTLENDSFCQHILQVLETYQPENEAIVVARFDDCMTSVSIDCSYFRVKFDGTRLLSHFSGVAA